MVESVIGSLAGSAGPVEAVRRIAQVGGLDFGGLLDSRSAAGGQGVSIDAGLDLGLSDAQMRRVSEAADRAASAGAKNALVMIDGRALRLDVESRRITAEVSLRHGDVLTGVDAVVQASEPGGLPGGLPGSAEAGLHPGILRALIG